MQINLFIYKRKTSFIVLRHNITILRNLKRWYEPEINIVYRICVKCWLDAAFGIKLFISRSQSEFRHTKTRHVDRQNSTQYKRLSGVCAWHGIDTSVFVLENFKALLQKYSPLGCNWLTSEIKETGSHGCQIWSNPIELVTLRTFYY